MTVNHALFTDVSVHPQSRRGVGVCLLVPIQYLDTPCAEIERTALSASCLCRRFTDTSSTMLELQTALWGLSVCQAQVGGPLRSGVRLYTDSQCIAGLSARRESLETKGYHSVRSGLPLANASLYREFFAASDELEFEVVKLAGHSRASTHDSIQRIFSVVDRAARHELKLWLDPEKLRD